jgi:exonuclease III
MRVLDWNLNAFTSARWRGKAALAADLGFDVLLLQECDRASFEGFLSSTAASSGVFGLDLSQDAPVSDRHKPHGSAILVAGRASLDLECVDVIRDLQAPSRGLVAAVDVDGIAVRFVSWHAPNAVGKGPSRMVLKMAAYRAMTDWLVNNEGSLVVGMDANTPWEDPWTQEPSQQRPADPWFEDGRLFGPSPAHPLVDAWRLWLSSHPAELERICRLRPSGPLAVTHNRGTGGSTKGCRYDHLLISRDLEVQAMGFEFADAVGAGSDHAVVWAELQAAVV